MKHLFTRTELLVGPEGLELLRKSKVAIFGIGGVGSYAAEAIARCGVGKMVLIDFDVVDITNINRQLIALHSTVGMPKVEVMKDRIADINPQAEVEAIQTLVEPNNIHELITEDIDYIVDAIDIVTGKLALIKTAFAKGVPIVSSMGAGNKLDPTKLVVTDISKTETCPLARVIRKELGKHGIKKGLKVVYSLESPLKPLHNEKELKENLPRKQQIPPGSISFVPSTSGLLLASLVINDLVKKNE